MRCMEPEGPARPVVINRYPRSTPPTRHERATHLDCRRLAQRGLAEAVLRASRQVDARVRRGIAASRIVCRRNRAFPWKVWSMCAFSADAQEPVFISYARADGSEHAQELERTLRLEGFTTWRDVRDIDLSVDFTSEIENAIKSSVAVVLCLTPDTGRPDSFMRREITSAMLANKPIIVARFADIAPPVSVVNNTYVDFHRSRDIALAQLLRSLRQKTSPSASLPETARNSYLAALYHEIIDHLDDAILLPVVGHRMQLLEATGLITRGKLSAPESEVLSSRYFRPAHGLVVGRGVRQALDYARRRLAIVGSPGSGKTIALMVLARDLASEALTDPHKPLPLLVSAASWKADGTAQPDLISWLAREVPMLADAIPDLIRSRQVIFCLWTA